MWGMLAQARDIHMPMGGRRRSGRKKEATACWCTWLALPAEHHPSLASSLTAQLLPPWAYLSPLLSERAQEGSACHPPCPQSPFPGPGVPSAGSAADVTPPRNTQSPTDTSKRAQHTMTTLTASLPPTVYETSHFIQPRSRTLHPRTSPPHANPQPQPGRQARSQLASAPPPASRLAVQSRPPAVRSVGRE